MSGSASRGLPKGVWFQRKKLASGEVVRYGYLGRGPGMQALGREGSPDFHETLAQLMRRTPSEGKVAFLIWRYKSSPEFEKLRPLTKRDYRRQLDKVQAKFGRLGLAVFDLPQISNEFYAWRDDMAKSSPRQADYAISVLGAMLSWGVKRGLLNHNRAKGIEGVYKGDRTRKVWTHDQAAALLSVCRPSLADVVVVALETGLSQEDLIALPKSAIQGNIIVTKRLKNAVPVAIPISDALRAALDAMKPSDSTMLLTTAHGLPWGAKGNGVRSAFREACDKARIEGLTFHDMRGTFITRRRSMGWTAEETALCSGHKVAGEAGAQGAYVDRRTVAMANANRLWGRFYGPNRERSLQTTLQTAPDDGDAKAI